jgi:hypothetical protein
VAEAKRLEEEKATVRLSQYGRQPSIIPPTPDVLDRSASTASALREVYRWR